MADSVDKDLQFKKRARRRLVGAVAFAGFAAVFFPMVMDEEPKQKVPDVKIRIPGQNETPFTPDLATGKGNGGNEANGQAATERPSGEGSEDAQRPVKPSTQKEETQKKPEETPTPAKPPQQEPKPKTEAPKANGKGDKPPEKEKPVTASVEDQEAKRAEAILSGKATAQSAQAAAGQHVILIGAFANPANVTILQKKLGELGLKTYTESLDGPSGKKTRLRVGPFSSRDSAEKGLAKMQRIGVSGVIATKP